ncbi:MAG TPA: NAD(P)/FAD-dependent oxidoreductase [Ilumatobacter sp.]|nr:NAD(P)/FAD-dependent oxidoreductase [Ilumatobacter sp.]
MTTTEPDLEAIRQKYQAERDKRIRAEGNDQYIEISGVFGHYADDPYVERVERQPLTDDVTVAFIGGGFAGLVTAARLTEAGVAGVRIIEKGGDFGGTWYWNRYPGAQCDTAAFIYLPLLEETGHMPTEKYTHGTEILEHCQRIGRHFGLYDNAVFSTEVTSLVWNEAIHRWEIRTNRGDAMTAQFVAMGTGPLHRPKLPGIPGIETFTGHSFHTSRWDYEYTGGDSDGADMDRLADKRVGIIGTGATAVQCVPHLAGAAGELFVFQRTPSSIDARNNRPTDPEWFRTLEPGWQEQWLLNFTTLQTGGFTDEDLVMDGWTDIAQRIRDRVMATPNQDFSPESLERAYHESDDEKMAEIRARVESIVDDEITAEKLKPWYRQLCKRPCFHDAYLQSYNVPGTHLVDTDGRGVERIDATGVWANGEHFELDLLIYASGFEVGTDYTRRSGFDVSGRDGVTLSGYWSGGMRSLHGIHVHGFPNLFVVGPTQGANLISNIPHNLTEAGKTIASIVRHALDVGAHEVEATVEAQDEWVHRLETAGRSFGGDPSCTPGYYNNEGGPIDRRARLNSVGYPDGPVAYFEYIDRWRNSGEFTGLAFNWRATRGWRRVLRRPWHRIRRESRHRHRRTPRPAAGIHRTSRTVPRRHRSLERTRAGVCPRNPGTMPRRLSKRSRLLGLRPPTSCLPLRPKGLHDCTSVKWVPRTRTQPACRPALRRRVDRRPRVTHRTVRSLERWRSSCRLSWHRLFHLLWQLSCRLLVAQPWWLMFVPRVRWSSWSRSIRFHSFRRR